MYEITLANELEINLEEIIEKIQVYHKNPYKDKQIQNIREKAEQIIPRKIGFKAKELVKDLCYDRKFCEKAGLNYNNPDSSLITIIIADYLIKKYKLD
jgi:hypothetical protein